MRRRIVVVFLVANAGLSALARGQASGSAPCHWVCDPSVAAVPSMIRTHLFGGPTVRTTATGATHRLPGSSDFEAIVVLAARTAIPRVSVFGSVQWLPNATAARNPFTLYTANELGGPVHANAPTATIGASISLITARNTAGWLDASANVGDLFSQAARPTDRGAYTGKLDLDLVTHIHAFDWAPKASYAHQVTLLAMLDYVATRLPRAGDEVPQGRVFVTGARPASLIVGLTLPIFTEAK